MKALRSMPHNPATAKVWLRRARGNLTRAKLYGGAPGTFYEDSCFDSQQAAEKAMKGLLIHLSTPYPKTHAIADLITRIEEAGVAVPTEVRQAAALTAYAVSARYPGVSEEVSEKEYRLAIELAERVVEWVEVLIYPVESNEAGSSQQ